MNVYVDTEFTSLGSDPRLISIALAADNGADLYIEFSNGWTTEQCSLWVRQHVLPQLGRGERYDRRATVERILAWLAEFRGPATLIVDSSWDAELISLLLLESGVDPASLAIQEVRFANAAERADFDARREVFLQGQSAQRHHALHDARALGACLQARPVDTASGAS